MKREKRQWKKRMVSMLAVLLLTCSMMPAIPVAAMTEAAEDINNAQELQVGKTYSFAGCDSDYYNEVDLGVKRYGGYVKFNIATKGKYTLNLKQNHIGESIRFEFYDANGNQINSSEYAVKAGRKSYTIKFTTAGTYYMGMSYGGANDGTFSLMFTPGGKPYLDKSRVSMSIGDSVTLHIKNAPAGEPIYWVSGKTSVATVSESGTISGVKAGVAYIYGIVNNHCYRCKVRVN